MAFDVAVVAKLTADLLPGLRRMRTPIFVGYCWIGLVWLVVRPFLPTPSAATGVMANIYELALALRVVGVLIFATVAAYLVGSLTVQLFMALLARLPVPSEARVVFLRRVDSSGQAPSFANYRGESTIPYVKTGQLPPELHAMDRFANDFGRLCAEAEFRWTAPVPLVLLGGYLAFSQSWWWAFPIVVVVVLMRDGRKRFLLACEQLHRAAAAQADQLHAEAAQAWDTAAGH